MKVEEIKERGKGKWICRNIVKFNWIWIIDPIIREINDLLKYIKELNNIEIIDKPDIKIINNKDKYKS